jgi:hypothetical protein
MADETLFLVIISIGSTLLGVFVGGIVTYYASIKVLQRQQNNEKVNIAKGFLSEIRQLEDWLQPSLDQEFLEDGKREIQFNLFKHILKLNWDRPFYDDDGLYFISRSQMYYFNEDIYEKLEVFYSDILIADEYRQVFLAHMGWGIDDVSYNERRRFKETIEAIKHTLSLTPEIKKKLQLLISTHGK